MSHMTQTAEELAFDTETKQQLTKAANTIRQLSIEAVQQANSGHPGLPLGCAELGAYFYGYALRHNPKHAKWVNRDRMILSAGHGSMWLYSCLHLAGFALSLDDIQHFRQLHSKTPGHPESLDTEGVETTTGPLGQGLGNAVGQALGLKLLAARFNTEAFPLFDSKVFCLAGDGCIMEGIAAEVSSLAGHLRLDNLIVIYDANNVSLDGPLAESCSEDTLQRYRAYGWDVQEIDGHDFDAIHEAVTTARTDQMKPCLIVARTVIGKGSPNKAGTFKVHGSPLGNEEVKLTKEALGLPEEKFFVPHSVKQHFAQKLERDAAREEQWNDLFAAWARANPTLAEQFQTMAAHELPEDLEEVLERVEMASPIAGRAASNSVINALAPLLPQLVGGSADLSCSDLTDIKGGGWVAPGIFTGRNIKYGVREFGMAAMATGLQQTGMFLPFVGTFLTFSDYMRNAIRLAALQRAKVVYQFTHDSLFLGEDGPTHQPIEHLASLRAIPHLQVIRPADAHEVKGAWLAALRYSGPSAIILSRQNLPTLACTHVSYDDGVGRGAYLVKKEERTPDYTLIATGSELLLALDVAKELERHGKAVRVVSMPCWQLFERQSLDYRHSVLGGQIGQRVSIEAGVEMGWHKYIGADGIAICMEGFGLSAPASALAREFGFTVESILERVL